MNCRFEHLCTICFGSRGLDLRSSAPQLRAVSSRKRSASTLIYEGDGGEHKKGCSNAFSAVMRLLGSMCNRRTSRRYAERENRDITTRRRWDSDEDEDDKEESEEEGEEEDEVEEEDEEDGSTVGTERPLLRDLFRDLLPLPFDMGPRSSLSPSPVCASPLLCETMVSASVATR